MKAVRLSEGVGTGEKRQDEEGKADREEAPVETEEGGRTVGKAAKRLKDIGKEFQR